MSAAPALQCCSRCGDWFDEVFFRRRRGPAIASPGPDRHYVCIGCEQTGRDDLKRGNRPLTKARNALRTHAVRYVRLGMAQDQPDFASRYGWDPRAMAHDIEHAASNGCPYCRKAFSSMAHGLADVTIDIVDPRRPPHYTTNTKWVCSTCNKAKRDDAPEVWARKLQCWAQYEERKSDELDHLRGSSPKAISGDQHLW